MLCSALSCSTHVAGVCKISGPVYVKSTLPARCFRTYTARTQTSPLSVPACLQIDHRPLPPPRGLSSRQLIYAAQRGGRRV